MTNNVKDKMSLEEIKEASNSIDKKQIAFEILRWIADSVDEFIDNQKKMFKLDLVVDENSEVMAETLKLQTLFREIPDDSEVINPSQVDMDNDIDLIAKNANSAELNAIIDCRETLNSVVEGAFEVMQSQHEQLNEIFKKMVFYYECTGLSRGMPLVKNLVGGVKVIKFEYEAFPVAVEVKQVDQLSGEKVEIKSYTIPDGFTVWLEIAFKEIPSAASLF